jgi:3-hydroxyacyl-CoA dehydrogenase/enoyl-CoA hydratase/3-hydroxybutyryl-CoA epimerase
VQEGLEMMAEGIAPAIIDNVGRATGMPRGPLEMNDDVALDLSYKIGEQTKKDLGDKYEERPFAPVLAKMVVELGRLGRKNGKGFYDYPEGGQKKIWPGLAELMPVTTKDADKALIEEIRTRLLYRQAVEAAAASRKASSSIRAKPMSALSWAGASRPGPAVPSA